MLFLAMLYAGAVALSLHRTSDVDPSVVTAAQARIERCARGYLGARLERAKHVVYVEDASVNRAQTVLPDTIRLNPEWRNDEWVVAHELLHVAIGRPGHPEIPFATCGLLYPSK